VKLYDRSVAITIRLNDEEKAALQKRATIEGISIQDAARRAVRAYVAREDRRERVLVAGKWVTEHHAEAIRRLAE
jgi:predicted transcriptional regulator